MKTFPYTCISGYHCWMALQQYLNHVRKSYKIAYSFPALGVNKNFLVSYEAIYFVRNGASVFYIRSVAHTFYK